MPKVPGDCWSRLFRWAIACGAIGGGILVDHVGSLGGPLFAVPVVTLGTLLALRFGPPAGLDNHPEDAALPSALLFEGSRFEVTADARRTYAGFSARW